MRRHSFAPAGRFVAAADDEPFSTMNTTPLIDVMLVLLVMVLITIPMALNKVPLDLPGPGPAEAVVTHRLVVDATGAVTLDGAVLGEAALSARLRRIATVGDVVTMRTDPAVRYERFVAALAVVKRAGVRRLGFERSE